MTAQQIDQLLQESIAQGTASLTLSRQLEQFLLPGRALQRTNRPYGTDASYNAMRLSRTEITRGFSVATKAAGMANPFVTRAYYHTSSSHPEVDICDEFEAESEANDGFEPDACPVPGVDSHPNCLCYVTHGVMGSDDFEALFEDGDLPADFEEQVSAWGDWQSIMLAIMGLLPDLWEQLFG